MMTLEQALLGKLAEECAEIAQRASKAQRFGLSEVQPGQCWRNADRLMDEVHDLMAVLRMLELAFPRIIDTHIDEFRLPTVIEKIEKYLDYSRELGQVEPRK